jgi:hypothetical protein
MHQQQQQQQVVTINEVADMKPCHGMCTDTQLN